MKSKLIAILFILSISLQSYGSNPIKENNDKIVLSYLDLNDKAIEFATSDICGMILRKNKGYLYPATKLILTKDGEKLLFVVTAIDNSWCNMFTDEETPQGYFITNGRIFIVSTKGDVAKEFESIFTLDPAVKQKSFDRTTAGAKATTKNPVWTYLHRGGDKMATVLDSVHTEKLGR